MRPIVIAILAANAAALHDAPPCGLKSRVNVFGSGFGFVHGEPLYSWPLKAWCRSDFFKASQRDEFLLVDRFEALGFFRERIEGSNNCVLNAQRRKWKRLILKSSHVDVVRAHFPYPACKWAL